MHTPLHYAAMNDSKKFIRYLLAAGALLTSQDLFGNTPLMRSLQFQLPMEAIDRNSLIMRNNAKRNVFHIAALHCNDNPTLFDDLYQKAIELCGAEETKNMLLEKDRAGITPLMYAKAASSRLFEKVEHLSMSEEANASPSKDQLTCGICQEIFQKPVILPSGDIFCLDCISKQQLISDEFHLLNEKMEDTGIEKVIEYFDLSCTRT
jgi:ankyrin repeat protein